METSLQPRERMLSRIRASLGPRSSTRPEAVKPFFAQASTRNGHPVAEFTDEVTKAGGQVSHAHSRAEVQEYIAALLPAQIISSSVALSDGQLIQDLGLCDWLQTLSTQVLTSNKEDPPNQYRSALLDCAIGVTTADYALADTGTLVLISGGERHRLISLLPPVHVCLLSPKNIFPSLTQLLAHVRRDLYSRVRPPQALTCITGPSRTADIEQQITMGVHGPQSLHVILYSPSSSGIRNQTGA